MILPYRLVFACGFLSATGVLVISLGVLLGLVSVGNWIILSRWLTAVLIVSLILLLFLPNHIKKKLNKTLP